MNRLISETMTPPSGGLTTTVTYDGDGNVISVSESDGTSTTYTYDDLNRVIQQTDPADGDTTIYTYDAAGNLISVTDPDHNMTKFTYDAFGDLISMTDPKFGATTFAYFAVPEPSTWAAMLLGFAGLAFAGRLRARKTSLLKADVWPQQAVKARCRPARP
jgi:YD repeat-containing protein